MAAKEAVGEVTLGQERLHDHPYPATTEADPSHIGAAGPPTDDPTMI